MTNRLFRDKNKRRLYAAYELQRLYFLCLQNDLKLPKNLRYRAAQLLNKLPRNSSKVRILNRCILTGRSHSVLRFCRLSRGKFRELALQGVLPGITKSSW
jgi:small subunit ribosomal protein S14